MKKKKFKNDIVYSTEDNVVEENVEEYIETLSANEQLLYVEIDRKQRKGKSVTMVSNFIGSDEDLKNLGKVLKTKCGVGGTVKNGVIEIQGEVRDKVIIELEKLDYRTKRKGG